MMAIFRANMIANGARVYDAILTYSNHLRKITASWEDRRSVSVGCRVLEPVRPEKVQVGGEETKTRASTASRARRRLQKVAVCSGNQTAINLSIVVSTMSQAAMFMVLTESHVTRRHDRSDTCNNSNFVVYSKNMPKFKQEAQLLLDDRSW